MRCALRRAQAVLAWCHSATAPRRSMRKFAHMHTRASRVARRALPRGAVLGDFRRGPVVRSVIALNLNNNAICDMHRDGTKSDGRKP